MSDFSNEYELKFIRKVLHKNSVAIDLGANVGIYTRVLADCCRWVYAFEPEPKNFKQLQINMSNHHNVSLYEAAASDVTGTAHMYLSFVNDGMHRMYPSKYTENMIPVKTIRIDDVPMMPPINLVKMDVEGFEYPVLQGMKGLLKRDKPIIITEFHPESIRESNTADPKRVYEMIIEDLNYNDPMHCITGEIIDNWERLEKVTSDPKGGVNLIFI